MDIGCYLTLAALYFFDSDPVNATGYQLIDSEFGVDYLTSGVIQFPTGHTVFSCSTQSLPQQSLLLEGTRGRLKFEIPFSHPDDQPGVLYLEKGPDIFSLQTELVEVESFNHYRNHVENFADIVSGYKSDHFNLAFSLRNMKLMDSLREH